MRNIFLALASLFLTSCSPTNANVPVPTITPDLTIQRAYDSSHEKVFNWNENATWNFRTSDGNVGNDDNFEDIYGYYPSNSFNGTSYNQSAITTAIGNRVQLQSVLGWYSHSIPLRHTYFQLINLTNPITFNFARGAQRFSLTASPNTPFLRVSDYITDLNSWQMQFVTTPTNQFDYILCVSEDALANYQDDVTNRVNEVRENAYQDGYTAGFNDGIGNGDAIPGVFGIFANVFDALGGFLNIRIFGVMTIGSLLVVPLVVGIIVAVIKIIRG